MTVKAEGATLLVQAKEDIMGEVKIGEKDKSETVCNITSFQGSAGTVYQATRTVALILANEAPEDRVFIIKVKPKVAEDWEETICEYTLKGTKVADDNAEFAMQFGRPDILYNITWKSGLQKPKYIDFYGAQKVKLVARTVNPRATVKYRIVDLDEKNIAGKEEGQLTNNKGTHISEDIELFPNKPTKIKLWGMSPSNATDNKKGKTVMTFNICPLAWSYENGNTIESFGKKAYDTIEVKEDSLGTDKKVYLLFAPWDKEQGYSIDNTALSTGQTAFELVKNENNKQYHKTSIDVSSLFAPSNPAQEVEAQLKVTAEGGTECFLYKVKIKKAL